MSKVMAAYECDHAYADIEARGSPTVTVSAMQIAPQPFGELLNSWFRTIGRTWKPLLAISLLVQIPLGLAALVAFWASGSAGALADLLGSDLSLIPPDEIEARLRPIISTVAIWVLLQIPATAYICLAAATPATTGRAARHAARKTGSGVLWIIVVLLAAAVLVGLPVAGWLFIESAGMNFLTVFATTVITLTVLVTMAWLSLSISFGLPIIAIEGLSPIRALSRSYFLVRGRWWITLGFTLLVGVITSAASQVLSLVLLPVYLAGVFIPWVFAVATVAAVVLQAPFGAASAAGYTIWYLDLRSRSETLLTEQLTGD